MDSLYNQKRIRARKNDSESGSVSGSTSDGSLSDDNAMAPLEGGQSSNNNDEGSDDAETSQPEASSESEENPDDEAASISFGALVKAQETLGKRKRGNADNDLEEPSHRSKIHRNNIDSGALERKADKKDTRDLTRTSKHAPAELTSKKAVSRKREVVPTHKIEYRDPRFEPLTGRADVEKIKRNYSFLDNYRDSEINELKSAIKKTKDPDAKEKLKRALVSMESRKQSEQRKAQEQEVLRQHRKEEKAKIGRGKKPFYLKKAEQKKMALTKRFEGMKGRQVDKVIERRRKKQAAKERKSLPDARRG
ncbi:rRNA biogenesis protein rrp36 [Lecanora helva]